MSLRLNSFQYMPILCANTKAKKAEKVKWKMKKGKSDQVWCKSQNVWTAWTFKYPASLFFF